MAWREHLQELQQIDLNELDLNNPGDWPAAVRAIALALVFVLVAVLGYFFYLTGKFDEGERLERQEQTLLREFEDKAADAAVLDQLREQREAMQVAFADLLQQLPGDTEVPALLEDITQTGLDAGLKFSVIDLEQERSAEFYRELPIAITVTGNYHDMGTFVSGVANLSRIVTLHDFSISPRQRGRDQEGAGGELTMEIEARTYRYHDGVEP